MIEVDYRGYSCPIPCEKTKRVCEENPGQEIKILLDDHAAVQNVTRFGKNSGYEVTSIRKGGEYTLVFKPLA